MVCALGCVAVFDAVSHAVKHGTFGVVRPISAGPVGARYTHRRRRRKSLTNTLLKPSCGSALPGTAPWSDHVSLELGLDPRPSALKAWTAVRGPAPTIDESMRRPPPARGRHPTHK